MKTQMEAAFAEKGFMARNVQLQLAIAKFQNNGGEWGVAYAMLCSAYGKGSEGLAGRASVGQSKRADASPTNDGEAGQIRLADKATAAVPASPSTATGLAMANGRAGTGPGHAKRGADAIASVQEAVGKSLFDTVMLPDGRRLRDVRWSECLTLASKYRQLSSILKAVHNHAIPANPATTLDEIVTERELKRIVSQSEINHD